MEIDDRINRLSTDRKLANIAAAIPGAGGPPSPMPPGTGIPQAMPTPPGTGIPQAIPQGGPSMPSMAQGGLSTMPQGDPRMLPFSDLASVSLNEDKDNAIFRAIKRLDQAGEKRSKEKENAKKENMVKMLAGIFESARRTGVRIPENMSPESGGLPTMSAAGGGRVVYRRDPGPVDPNIQTEAEREAIRQQIHDMALNYGVDTKYWDMLAPLSPENNPVIFDNSGDDPAWAGQVIGNLVGFQYPGSGVPQNQIAGTSYGVQQGFGGFRAEHERLLGQIKEAPEEEGPKPFQPIENERYGYPNTDTGTGTDIGNDILFDSDQRDPLVMAGPTGGLPRREPPGRPPEGWISPRRFPEEDPIDIFDQDRYGGLGDPNLPSLDAAQLRNLYRQQVGFFDTPPGPTDNTRRLLHQAYGDDSPIYAEVLGGLQPDPRDTSEEAARLAFYNLPGNVWPVEEEVVDETVTAAGGGGLYELAAGGEFSGRVPGDGGGMQDNVRMPIKEGANQVATLAVSPTEYVVDSHTMAALGNGNPDKGADHMDNVVKGIRRQAYGNDKQPNQINGLRSLRSMMG